jgi:thiosulfate dehydrogenase
MIGRQRDFSTWALGLLFLGVAVFIGYKIPHEQIPLMPLPTPAPQSKPAPTKESDIKTAFQPPSEDKIPNNEFGQIVKLGAGIFHDTQRNAKEFVGNSLQCANCHIDKGRLANSAPLWAAYVAFPTYRAKNKHVNTFQERMQGCFRFSMNGKAPDLNSKVLVALESYAHFLASGAPTGAEMPGRGYPKLPKPAKLDYGHGQEVYEQKCALCHGADGQGQQASEGTMVFPPLWGPRSFNWGAGMSSITNAAGFVKANMPFSQGNTLADQEAWDVATYLDSQERPQDPRFKDSVAETRKAHHDSPMDMYGQTVNGVLLGQNSPPSGPQAQ